MGAWLNALAGPLLDALVAAGLFLGSVSLAMALCRQPSRRCWLARLGLVGALAIGPLSASGVVPRIDLGARLRAAAPPSWPRPRPSELRPEAWPTRLAAGYLAVAGLGLATLVLGGWGAGRVIARSQAPSAPTLALYEELAVGLPPRRRPRVRVSPRLRRPGLLGVVRPWIMIPPSLDRPEAGDALRLCLLHELVHARRLDPLFAQLAAVIQALAFPWPQSWWIRAQMRLDQEYLADHLAASRFGTTSAYAASLLDLAAPGSIASQNAPLRDPAPPCQQIGSRVFRRVLMLVRCPFPVETTPPRTWKVMASSLVLAGTLLASSLTLQASAPPRPAFPTHGTFRMGHLSLLASSSDGQPASPPFRIPLGDLPPHYQLTLQVWAESPSALTGTRILGLPLANGPVPAPSWHSARIVREPDHLSLWLDDQPIHDRVPPPAINLAPTFEAPHGQPAWFRQVELVW